MKTSRSLILGGTTPREPQAVRLQRGGRRMTFEESLDLTFTAEET